MTVENFDEFFAAFAQVQGQLVAHHHVLRRLLAHVAMTEPDPSSFLSKLYESISATVEQKDHVPGEIARTTNVEMKYALESLFLMAGKEVQIDLRRNRTR